MPTVRPLLDVEELVVGYLLADTAVAALTGTRVSTQLPSNFTAEARVRIVRVGGSEGDSEPAHIDRPNIQIDAYGTDKGQAWDVMAETVRAILEMPSASFTGAVVTSARRVLGPLWQPDPETFDPHYLANVILSVHPAPPASL